MRVLGLYTTLTYNADLTRYLQKNTSQKADFVRRTLMPVLSKYADHPSNTKLRAEDLDRRANILNKWWTGLLDMIAGLHNQSISGTDRPVILEAIVGIMERSEWRLTPDFSPLAKKGDNNVTALSQSTLSLSSTSSDFLVESVQHNVKNMFIQNLLAQMRFVVDKMSLRHAPASLVQFCGKTCAFAFFFCPGIADILVRLWGPSQERSRSSPDGLKGFNDAMKSYQDTLRRVLVESGIEKFERLDEMSRSIAHGFPSELRRLALTSLPKMMRELRKPAMIPLATNQVAWHGPWLKRWSGTDSDLFYTFVKQFHVLLLDFLPAETSARERMCAPGVLMIHAQILTNLDATVHRNTNQFEDFTQGPGSNTFDDILDPDATAPPMPMSPTNATRLMAENRLIMLIRDFLLTERYPIPVRHFFAEAFCDILKASAKRISVYDNSAQFLLCDFLEEALAIIIRYEHLPTTSGLVLDWPFWLSVCKSIQQSSYTASEIKLYSFLYTVWVVVCGNADRRRQTCEFLLDAEVFESRFNHWCPMVRAYYMRLLCWRLARFDGEAGEDDM
jgi:hypothetical protein